MPKLYQHQLDDTYYTRLYWPGVSAIVTRQIHPDGVVFLKRQGVQLEGEIPSWLIDELADRNWLATKEEMPYWGIVDWPRWHLIDAPKPKSFPKENPFKAKKREAARAAKLAAEEEQRRAAEEDEQRRLEEKRAANRERGQRYRAQKKAEAEEAVRKAEARRERDRRYRAKKRAEVEAAQEAASTVASSPSPSDDSDMGVESLPTHSVGAPAGNAERRESTKTQYDSLTQLAPRKTNESPAWPGSFPVTAASEPDRPTLRLIVLLGIGIILLVLAVGQVFDFLPM